MNHHDYISGVLETIAAEQDIYQKRILQMTQQATLLSALSNVRAEANAKPTIGEAVDHAVIGTATALQTAIQVIGDAATVFADLPGAIAAHFVEEINAPAAEGEALEVGPVTAEPEAEAA